MKELPVYLDYMATTPVDERVIEKMLQYMGFDSHFGNPASTTHAYGQRALAAVEQARAQVASVINASPEEIIWTSGATESDNLAISGAARFYQRKGRHLITMSTEHKAVLDTCEALFGQGFEITYLTPEADGLLDIKQLEQAIRPDTVLVSIMHVNNEIGVIQDIAAIGALLHDKGILLHVDAAQSVGKVGVDVEAMRVDLMSLSAHKAYGPKGIGALYVRRNPRVRLEPLIHGGGHEHGLRSGTLATHQIVGMGEAFMLAEADLIQENQRLSQLGDKLLNRVLSVPGVTLNGHRRQRVPNNLNLCFGGIDGDSLLLALQKLAVSTTSACSSASVQPSYVLKAIGLSDEQAHSSIRLSMGRFTTEADIDKACDVIEVQVERLQRIAGIASI